MVEITLFEIHLDGAQVDAEATANAPLSGLSSLFGSGSEESEQAEGNPGSAETAFDVQADEEGGRAGPSIGKLLLSVVVLAVVAALARRALGGEDSSVVDDVADAEITPINVGE